MKYVYNENERDSQHVLGKASDEKGIQVAAAILAKSVASYELKIRGSDQIFTLEVSLSGDQLSIGGSGAANTPLQAVSETEFSAPYGNLKFPKEGDGAAPNLTFQLVEGEFS